MKVEKRNKNWGTEGSSTIQNPHPELSHQPPKIIAKDILNPYVKRPTKSLKPPKTGR